MKKKYKILSFRLSAIGDVAMTIPVILAVLKQNPEVEIDYVTPRFLHNFFPKHPRLQLLDFDKKKENKGLKGIYKLYKKIKTNEYDAYVDLHNVLRSSVLGLFLAASVKDRVSLDKGRKEKRALTRKKNKKLVPLRPMTERYADVFRKLGLKVELSHKLENQLFSSQKRINAIGIAPFAKHKEKAYPLDKTLEVAKQIAKTGTQVFVFGSKAEALRLSDFKGENIEVVAGKYNFREELRLIAQLQCMLSMDSSNMHLASLVGTPVISIWGATHPFAGFLGYGQKMENAVQRENLSCRPCSVFGNKKCWRKDWACMDIEPQEIVGKTKRIVNK